MSQNKEEFLQDVRERLQTLLDDLESWVIVDHDLDVLLELTTQVYDEVDALVDE